jgi:hypothetical protein
MIAHTPGPWIANSSGDVALEGDSNSIIAWCTSPDSVEDGDGPAMANARLIAAAPEMLEALKKLTAICPAAREAGSAYWRAIEFASRAIAKAEGKS